MEGSSLGMFLGVVVLAVVIFVIVFGVKAARHQHPGPIRDGRLGELPGFVLYPDRLLTPHGVMMFEEGPIEVAVEHAGNVAVGRRVGLGRVAAGTLVAGPLGGVVAGAGFKKDRVYDSRQVYLTVASPRLTSFGAFHEGMAPFVYDFAAGVTNVSRAVPPSLAP